MNTVGLDFNDVLGYTVAIHARETLPLNELLANRCYDRILDKLLLRCFISWRNSIFTILYTRDNIVNNHLSIKVVAKVFYNWKRNSHMENRFGPVLRRYWRRRRVHAFALWRSSARWQSYKLGLLDDAFGMMFRHTQYQQNIADKWGYLRCSLASRTIAWAFERFRFRRIYWATFKIKKFIMKRMSLRVIRHRRRQEHKRSIAENETVSILSRRMQACLTEYLSSDVGQVAVIEYTAAVNKCMEIAASASSTTTLRVFPTSQEMPAISHLTMWTVRSKALCVLKERCKEVVRVAAIKRYRKIHPPLYECLRCLRIFYLKAECYDHCKYRCPTEEMHGHGNDKERDRDRDSDQKKNIQLLDIDIDSRRGRGRGKGKKGDKHNTYHYHKNPHWSRIYSKELNIMTKYSFKVNLPKYSCALLCQPLVCEILKPIEAYLGIDK